MSSCCGRSSRCSSYGSESNINDPFDMQVRKRPRNGTQEALAAFLDSSERHQATEAQYHREHLDFLQDEARRQREIQERQADTQERLANAQIDMNGSLCTEMETMKDMMSQMMSMLRNSHGAGFSQHPRPSTSIAPALETINQEHTPTCARYRASSVLSATSGISTPTKWQSERAPS